MRDYLDIAKRWLFTGPVENPHPYDPGPPPIVPTLALAAALALPFVYMLVVYNDVTQTEPPREEITEPTNDQRVNGDLRLEDISEDNNN